MYAVICIRESAMGNLVAIPIMKSDDEGNPGESMAQFESEYDASKFISQHPLCKASMNVIVDLDECY
jgi:hypothetical protein